jgi:RhtB (resistance to homoserine/threonine) family protein
LKIEVKFKNGLPMYGIENYTGFILTAVLLNLTPGADTIYILTRSISQGQRPGVYSVLGIMSGVLVHTVLAAFGLSLILAKSTVVFHVVKYAGVAYLMYLGAKMILDKNKLFDGKAQQPENANLFQIYRQGLITNVLNPKVALFFISFLPQFINTNNANGSIPFLILGVTFMITGTIWCLILVYAASLMTKTLRVNEKIGGMMQKICGLVFVGLGIKLLTDK